MVDKIDKPEAPSPYAVSQMSETKRDKQEEQKGQEDLPTFKKEGPSLFKEKFQGEPGVTKTFHIALSDIASLQFKRATPRQGIPTAEADLILKDGTKIEAVGFLLKQWQDFLKIKHLKVGDTIPEEFWKHGGETLEITIRPVATSGPWNLREIEKSKTSSEPKQNAPLDFWQALDKRTLIYSIGIVGIVVLLAVYLMRL